MQIAFTKPRAAIAALTAGLCLCTTLALAQGAPDARTKALIEGAQKEGELVYIDNLMAPESRKAMHEAFLKRYGLKNFKITPYLLKSSEVIARVDQELKADRVSADWVLVNVATFWRDLEKRRALMEYCSPEYAAFTALAQAGVPDGGCYFKASLGVAFTPMWNPKYVKEDLDSWEKIVDPKYKGQIIFSDPLKGAVYLDTYIGMRKVLPVSWFKKMAGLKPFFLVRSTDIRDKIMTGEYAIAVLGYAPRAYQVRKDVELKVSYPKEGVVVLGSFAGIMAKAAHPNAAKLWTDFFYSKEGMAILRKHEAVIAGRGDLAPDTEVEKFVPSISKLKIIKVDWDKLTEKDRKAARAEYESIVNN
jgi:iron(III) transport system substrate-binding protein